MATDTHRVKALFQAAIERHDLVERREFLDAEIGDDAELRGRLDALLSAYDQPSEALERPLGEDMAVTADVDPDATRDASSKLLPTTEADEVEASPCRDEAGELLETVIAGRYRLRQEIGEGGMGSVFLAEQTQPVKGKRGHH